MCANEPPSGFHVGDFGTRFAGVLEGEEKIETACMVIICKKLETRKGRGGFENGMIIPRFGRNEFPDIPKVQRFA